MEWIVLTDCESVEYQTEMVWIDSVLDLNRFDINLFSFRGEGVVFLSSHLGFVRNAIRVVNDDENIDGTLFWVTWNRNGSFVWKIVN